MSQKNEYCGYGLFNDVEDAEVQSYNRGRIIVNILEDNSNGQGKISDRGAMLSAGYLLSIPEDQRSTAYAEAEKILQSKGTINAVAS